MFFFLRPYLVSDCHLAAVKILVRAIYRSSGLSRLQNLEFFEECEKRKILSCFSADTSSLQLSNLISFSFGLN